MHWNDGWGGWFFLGLFMLIAWDAVVWAIVYVTRDRGRRPDARREEPRSMDILEERFARGEIDEQEFRASVVPACTVSFRVFNAGGVTHELVVLPLPPGGVGTRATGPVGRVGEAGSLGEASAPGGEGAGEGIRPGTWSWVSPELSAGSYELVCNLPGHYARGMYTELDVR